MRVCIDTNALVELTSDRHFDVLHSSGYKPKPIAPQEIIARHL